MKIQGRSLHKPALQIAHSSTMLGPPQQPATASCGAALHRIAKRKCGKSTGSISGCFQNVEWISATTQVCSAITEEYTRIIVRVV